MCGKERNIVTRVIELRSDTYTKPTPSMLQAMVEFEVGNDGVDEDPTVNRLQEVAAQRLGKEAALFVASGTMGNLCAVMAHCRPGEAVILDPQSHLFCDEGGNVGAVAGCLAHSLNCPGGVYDLNELRSAFQAGSLTRARTGLVCLENTHNRRGGLVVSPEDLQSVADLAHAQGIPVHLDGARIFNAAVALGIDVAKLSCFPDSVMFCLSKGLACPVGSLLAGTREFIARAKKVRRMLGGGMRQAGVLAAAGLVALETMVDRLADDHRRAQELADGLAGIPGLRVAPPKPATNMVYLVLDDKSQTDRAISALSAQGVECAASERGTLRLVTHYEITDADVAETIQTFRDAMATRSTKG